MKLLLEGRVALITGAGRGIGRSIALAFAEQGAPVALVARRYEDVSSVAEEVRQLGGRAIAISADVSVEAQAETAVATTLREFGKVDILVNNAGTNQLGSLSTMSSTDWWRVIDVNLKGMYLFSRLVVAGMVERGWGRIITISSANGKQGSKFGTAYCSAKHAQIGFTRALALEVGESGVTVNAVCPGFVGTDLTDATGNQRSALFKQPIEAVKKSIIDRIPQRVVMAPDEVAPVVVFLASDGAKRITGDAVNVSAGMVMH